MENAIRGQCPHCGKQARHAFLPSLENTKDVISIQLPTPHDVGTRQQFVCTACETAWEAAIVPMAQVKQFRAAAESLTEAKRQIAMLRLIMAKDQLERADRGRSETIKLHRAA
jgi:hypothetical protein